MLRLELGEVGAVEADALPHAACASDVDKTNGTVLDVAPKRARRDAEIGGGFIKGEKIGRRFGARLLRALGLDGGFDRRLALRAKVDTNGDEVMNLPLLLSGSGCFILVLHLSGASYAPF